MYHSNYYYLNKLGDYKHIFNISYSPILIFRQILGIEFEKGGEIHKYLILVMLTEIYKIQMIICWKWLMFKGDFLTS